MTADPQAPAPDPVEVPADGAIVARTGCDGSVLILAIGPDADLARATKTAHDLHHASGLKVIAVADVAAVRAWHPHDAAPAPGSGTQATPGQAAAEAWQRAQSVPGRIALADDDYDRQPRAWDAVADAAISAAQLPQRLAKANTALKAELTSLREQHAKALAANQRWAETLGDIQQAGRERDKAREQLATTQAHRERLNRELATLTRQLNARDRQDAAIREKIAAYHDGQLNPISAFGDIVKLIEADHD